MRLAKKIDPAFAVNFLHTLAANVDNTSLDDDHFRAFVENSLEVFQEGGAASTEKSDHDNFSTGGYR